MQVGAQEGKLLFMSTNHVDRLEPALVRPGRVDVRYALGLCSTAQACDIIMHFYQAYTLQDPTPSHRSNPPAACAANARAHGSLLLTSCARTPTGDQRSRAAGQDGDGKDRGSDHDAAQHAVECKDADKGCDAASCGVATPAGNSAADSIGASKTGPVGAGAVKDLNNPGGASGLGRGTVLERTFVERVVKEARCDGQVSPAALQGHLMRYKQDPGGALAALPVFIQGLMDQRGLEHSSRVQLCHREMHVANAAS